jgi:soluble lytic murein transglycosylase-like protein
MRLSSFFLLLPLGCLGQPYEPKRCADQWAASFAIDRQLVYAIIEAESAWNPRAVSVAGAAGLMQLMPATAASIGVRNRFEPCENIRGGVTYLASLRSILGEDLRLVLAGYNAGPGAVQAKGLRYSSEPVTAYVRRVLAIYRRIQREAPRRGGSN